MSNGHGQAPTGSSRWPEHLRAVQATEGYLSPQEASLLYELASSLRDGCIVEIGSYRGRSTVALALGARAGSGPRLYAVDPHDDFVGPLGGTFGPSDRVAFFTNLLSAGVVENVRLVNLPSVQAAAGWELPVGLLWIDGDHSYPAVRADVGAWLPHLAPGGALAFHDATVPDLGPMRVVGELTAAGFQVVDQIGSLAVLRRAPV